MRESVIEKHLVKRVKELGGEVRKVRWVGRNGAPDRLVMLPARITTPTTYLPGVTCFVELKAPGKPTMPHQAREHERMRNMGQRVEVIDSIEGVEDMLQ